MQKNKVKSPILLSLRIAIIGLIFVFLFEYCFFEILPSAVIPVIIPFFIVLFILDWYTNFFQKKDFFKFSHLLFIVVLLFGVVHFRVGVFWALNTFPLKDANMVLLTLQEPFDDFAYSMVKQYLSTTIPQTFAITVIFTLFFYAFLNNTKKRLVGVGVYFAASLVFFFCDIPVFDYVHVLNKEPEKSSAYSKFFVENYVNPDSIKITQPERKRNLVLIYLESLETSFADKSHGGFLDENLIPEITELAQQNLNFGKNKDYIGGGFDACGSTSTFPTYHSRSLGIPNVINYTRTPILHHYKSLYKILNQYGYKQVFFQGNSGLYKQFHYFSTDQKIDEVYGPDDLIQRLGLDSTYFNRKPNFRTVQDREAFQFADQILDTIQEPFSLTFFTIDTHAPYGLYDPDCVKSADEKNENELLKASVRCVSRELKKFLLSLKTKPIYENTSVIVFGDHRFMGSRLVKGSPNRKWVNIFINSPKTPVLGERRLFTDVDMFPTILSSINFVIDGDRLGFGTDLFSGKKTLVETIGLDSLNKEFDEISGHLVYESYLLRKRK